MKQATILLYGLGCSGKSFSLATLFKMQEERPEQRVIILTTEKNALDGLRRGLKHYKIDLKPGQLYYSVVKPSQKKAFTAELAALEKFSKDTISASQQSDKNSSANKEKYTYFIDVVRGLTRFKSKDFVTEEEKDLGNISDFKETDILVIDGLSPIIHGIWNLIQGDRKINMIGDYQIVQKQIKDFTSELVNSLSCSLIMLGHADRVMDDIEKKESIRVALDAGVALSGKYIGAYSDVIYAYKVAGNPPKFLWSGNTPNVEIACRNFPEEKEVIPDFSLYNFFDDKVDLTKFKKGT